MNHKMAILYGIAIWAFVFIVAMMAFPLRVGERPLFESIMPVALTLALTVASVRFLRTVAKRQFFIGVCLGLIWFAVNFLIDQLMFSRGPMQMSFADYLKDIGVTYLLVLIIPSGIGYALERKGEMRR